MKQITTCSFFKVRKLANKWWAFKQMQFGGFLLQKVKGLSFYKIMGSGAKNGFSSIPNLSTYVILCVWDTEQDAINFFDNNTFFKTYQNKSIEHFTIYLQSAESHGYWDRKQPFEKSASLALDKPVVVLTRASIRIQKLWSFWKRVGRVSESLNQYKGLKLSIGVGEWPLVHQATISIWKTQAEMLDYAYKNRKHREVVLLTRKLNWYKEELFARFVPYKADGSWNGEDAAFLL